MDLEIPSEFRSMVQTLTLKKVKKCRNGLRCRNVKVKVMKILRIHEPKFFMDLSGSRH